MATEVFSELTYLSSISGLFAIANVDESFHESQDAFRIFILQK